MSDILMVFVTVGDKEESLKIAQTLVNEKLVACVNIVPGIRSIYRWKDEVCDDEEFLLIMKTQTDLFPSLQKRVQEIHSYEVAEIIALPIAHGSPDYLQWVVENTSR
jgi:periplasmic divalent cation tolerance protein